MAWEYFQIIKYGKELKDYELNKNESENSLDIQENDNEEFFHLINPMNLYLTYKTT